MLTRTNGSVIQGQVTAPASQIFVTVSSPIDDPRNFTVDHRPFLNQGAHTLKVNGRAVFPEGLNCTDIKKGDHLIVVADGDDVVKVVTRVINHFNTAGKDCFSGVVQERRDDKNDIIVLGTVNGQKRLFRTTPLTRLFQAQADMNHAQRIYNRLKTGDSVVMWTEADPQVYIPHVDLLTQIYR